MSASPSASPSALQQSTTHILIRQPLAHHDGQLGELIKWKKSNKKQEYVASVPLFHMGLRERFDGYLRERQHQIKGKIAYLGGHGQLYGLGGLHAKIAHEQPVGSKVRLVGQPMSVVIGHDVVVKTLCHSDAEILKELQLIAKREKLSSRKTYGYVSSLTVAKHRSYHHYHRGSIQIDATDCIIKHLDTIKPVEGSESDLENPESGGVYGPCLMGPAPDEDIIAYEIRLFKINFWSGRPYFI